MIVYTISFVFENEIYVLCDESKTLVAWKTIDDLTKSFRKMYVNMAKKDVPFMVPAHLSFFSFRSHPTDMTTFEPAIVGEASEMKECRSKVGTCLGIKCTGPKVSQWRKAGTSLDVDIRKTIKKAKRS